MDTRIDRIETRDTAARDAIFNALDAFNDAKAGDRSQRSGWACCCEPAFDRVTGGLWAVSYYDWMFVELLFVPGALRGQGIGSRLIAEAEEIARTRKCLGIWLDTFSFQAPKFYEKLGFRLVGRIDDYPPGSSRSFFAKRLDGSARSEPPRFDLLPAPRGTN